jgi:hypothetical protein
MLTHQRDNFRDFSNMPFQIPHGLYFLAIRVGVITVNGDGGFMVRLKLVEVIGLKFYAFLLEELEDKVLYDRLLDLAVHGHPVQRGDVLAGNVVGRVGGGEYGLALVETHGGMVRVMGGLIY